MEMNDTAPDERRDAWRTELELPMRWCRLPGLVDAESLAESLGLGEWYRRECVMGDLEVPLRNAIDQVADVAARDALRLIEGAIRRLFEPPMADQPDAMTPMNLSVDGMRFTLPSNEHHLEPRDWLGVVLRLPEGYPLMACLEIVWLGESSSAIHIGGRFHHVQENSARKLARHVLLNSAH